MKLYVGNLPFQAGESDLESWFAEVGITVEKVTIIRDRFSGEPRGFGFVEIASADQGQAAVQACNGKDFMGRALVVNEARPERSGGGGGGGRPSGGGGRPGGPRRPGRRDRFR